LDDAVQHVIRCEGHFSTFVDVDQSRWASRTGRVPALAPIRRMGFCKGLPLEQYYRNARICRIFDGTSAIHRGVTARRALKKGAALFNLQR
jgi:alkylation response protein AidB-like acyl-CoA dehydrogenase